MTKTERLRRSRNIRSHLAQFNDLQDKDLREHVIKTYNENPDYTALNHLLMARTELAALIERLRVEGYGAKFHKRSHE